MSARRRVGIVGGSIGGCTAAVCLSRRGWEVELFERSPDDLVGRGAGIATFTALLDWLAERDLIGADLPRLDAPPLRWAARDGRSHSGRLFGADPARAPSSALSWGDLHTHLRGRVPDDTYFRGRAITGIELDDLRPVLHLDDGSHREYDVVVCADGYRSLGRSTLFPEAGLDYRGYVLWRGLLPHGSAHGADLLEDGGVRCGYAGGHGLFYLVPSSRPGDGHDARDINWGLYLQVPDADLAEVLTDRLGRRSEGSVGAGMIRPDLEASWKARAADLLPGLFAEIVDASRDTFTQAIFTVTVPAYRSGRVCLVGDAGTVYPPFSGSGVVKAISNAVELGARLKPGVDIDEALTAWSDGQLQTAATFEAAAAVFEQELIFDMPDLAKFDDDAFAAWNSAVFAKVPAPPV